MVICTKCKKELPDEALFCDNCGTKVEQKPVEQEKEEQEGTFIFCPACGSKISTEYEFCPECGSNIKQQLGTGTKQPDRKPKTRGKGKKIASIFLVLVILLGIGVGGVCIVRSIRKDDTNCLLYIKKNKLFMTGDKEEDPVTLSKKLDENKKKIFRQIGLQGYVMVYKDDKRIVYPDKMSFVKDNDKDDEDSNDEDEYEDDEDSYDEDEYDEDEDEDDEDSDEDENFYDIYEGDVLEYSLYYRSLKDSEAEPVKIDSGIQNAYRVTEDGSRIFYEKDSGLYVYDFEKKDKLASDVTEYKINEDGSRVVYFCKTGLYYKEDGKDKQKLADSVLDGTEFTTTADFSKVYYVTEDLELCQRAIDGKKSKLADKVSGIGDVTVYDSGELYYTTSEELELNTADYITDDMSPSEPLAEPEEPKATEPDPIYREDFESDEAFEKASKKYDKQFKKWQKAWEKYQKALASYEETVENSEIIEAIMETSFTVPKTTYYYYDGTTSKELGHKTGSLLSEAEKTVLGKSKMIFYKTKDEDLPNLKLSEVFKRGEESDDVYEMNGEEMSAFAISELKNAFGTITDEIYLAVGGLTYNLGSAENTGSWDMNVDGTFIMYLEDENLMQIMVKDGKPQKASVYDTDVSGYSIEYSSSENKDEIFCFKNFNDEEETGDLYKNKVKIDEEVYYDYYYDEEVDDSLYYYKDYDMESKTATLMVYEDGKTKEIAVDVHSYDFFLVNDKFYLYYITDWDDENESGSVYCVKNDKPVKMVDDVDEYYVLEDGSFYYLTDYDSDKETADLYLYQEKEDKLVESEVEDVWIPYIITKQEKEK